MKKRVRKTQRFTIWDKFMHRYRDVVIKHDGNRPVRMPIGDRVANYRRQNGHDRLTPRQHRRVTHKVADPIARASGRVRIPEPVQDGS